MNAAIKIGAADVLPSNIPDELKCERTWLNWRREERRNSKGEVEIAKVPISPHNGYPCDVTNSKNYATFADATRAMWHHRADGLGFAFTANGLYAGIDLDNCIDSEGAIDNEVAELISNTPGYWEVSPSGRGVKGIILAPGLDLNGTRVPGYPKAGMATEVYPHGRYFTVTGHVHPLSCGQRPLPDSRAQVQRLYASLTNNEEPARTLPAFAASPLKQSDRELLEVARRAKNGEKFTALYDRGEFGESQSEADLALCNMLAFYLSNDPARIDSAFRLSALMRDKWDRNARAGETYGEGTIREAIKAAKETYTPPRAKVAHRSNGNGGDYGSMRSHTAVVEDDPENSPAPVWKPVLPIQEAYVRPFPLEIFPAWARDYLQAVTDCLRTPPDFVGMWFLGLMALVVQKRFLLRVKSGWFEQLVLWVIVAAWSGTRKSPAFKFVFEPAVQWNSRMDDEFKLIRKRALRDVKNLEAEIEALRKRKAAQDLIRDKEDELDKITVPAIPKLFAGTATPERVETCLMEQLGRFGLASAESDVLAMMLGKYRNGGAPPIEVFLAAWSGDDIDSEYQARGSVSIKEPHLTTVFGTQPDNLHDFFGQRKLGGRGAVGRFLPSQPHCEICEEWDTGTVDPQLASTYCDSVLKLAPSLLELEAAFGQGRFEIKTLHFAPAAWRAFTPFYQGVQRRRKPGGDLCFNDEWTAKLAGQTARIAALLHICDHPGVTPPTEVSGSAAQRAVTLAEEYLIPMAKKVFGRHSILPKLQKLWANILSFGTPEVKRTMLGQSFGMSGDDIDTGLELLEEHNFLRVEKRRTGMRGPLSQIIVLRPEPPKTVSGVSGVSANGVKPLVFDLASPCLELSGISGVSTPALLRETPENSRETPDSGVSARERLETEPQNNSRNSRNSREVIALDDYLGRDLPL